jgi:hypothetical protein
MSAGAYILYVGETFYIGSTTDFVKRLRDHSWRLRNGNHPNPTLQKSFSAGGDLRLLKKSFLSIEEGETDDDFRDRLRCSEQTLLDDHWGDPKLANRSPNSRGPNNGEAMLKRWQDPDYYAKMKPFIDARKGVPVSAETRKKMSEAKRGSRNTNSRKVAIHGPEGVQVFVCASDAARFLGVSQQNLQSWMTGKSPWPGTSSREPKREHNHIKSYSAEFVVEA